MLRLSLSAPRAVAAAIAYRQSPVRVRQFALVDRRYYAAKKSSESKNVNTKPSIKDPTPPVIPGGASPAAPPAPPSLNPSVDAPGVSSPPLPSVTRATQAPLAPPAAPGPPWPTRLVTETSATVSATKVAPADATPPPTPPPTKLPGPPRKRHRLRNFLIFLTLLTGSAFAGGVYYSLRSDNFHDFFTEYIPFGEEAVLYFEEREFRKRFPNALSRAVTKREPVKVTIGQRSGATWKIHEEEGPKTTDLASEGPHIKSTGPKPKPKVPEQHEPPKTEETKVVGNEPLRPTTISEEPLPPPKGPERVEAAQKAVAEKQPEPAPAPRVPGPRIVLLEITPDADPVVQGLTKIINNIISVANESQEPSIFESAISSAKAELARLNQAIAKNKEQAEQAISEKLKEQELEFAKAAQGILSRVDQEAEQISERYQEQVDQIKENLLNAYRQKLHTELERSNKLAEQRLQNELVEQAIEMKRRWIKEIKDRVEEERNGRLGKLKELNESIKELEAITSKWADVLQKNLKVQQLHVAVEAVRNVVDDPQQPRPFIRELAALKDVAEDDEVVRAAIASINPRAYQKGVYSPAQLTDRFRVVSEEVRKAALLPENAGVAGHAASWLLSKLLFKKKGLALGDDVESILTRTETFLEEGDLDNAAREMNQLQGWARILARDWLREARQLLEVKQALEVIGIQARLIALRST